MFLNLPFFLAFVDDRLHGRLADALNGRKSETDVSRFVGREVLHRLVYVGTEHLYTHVLALGHVGRYLLYVRKVAAQQGAMYSEG